MFFLNDITSFDQLEISSEVKAKGKSLFLIENFLFCLDLIVVSGLYKSVGNKYLFNRVLKEIESIKPTENIDFDSENTRVLGQRVLDFLYGNLKSVVIIDYAVKFKTSNKKFEELLAYFLGFSLLNIFHETKFIEKNGKETLALFLVNEFNSKYYSYSKTLEFKELAFKLNIQFDDTNSSILEPSSIHIFISRLKSILISKSFWMMGFVLLCLLSLMVYWFVDRKPSNSGNPSNEIIEKQELELLKDSLELERLKALKFKEDSTYQYQLDEDHTIDLIASSSLVSVIEFLNDPSIQNDTLAIMAFEIGFSSVNDELIENREGFLRDIYRILYYNNHSEILIKAFSEFGNKSAERRSFFLKNRLVGEGISVKRIKIDSNYLPKPDPEFSLNSQISIRVTK